jgi:small subunit ribosomal protein S16
MVVVRLARGGAKKRPFYNIVATDSRNPRDGRFIERVGFYNPVAAAGDVKFRVAADRLGYWSGVGAQLSPTVARLVKQFGGKDGIAPAGAGVAEPVAETPAAS